VQEYIIFKGKPIEKTKPKKFKPVSRVDPSLLVAGRYGTDEMVEIWGAGWDKTMEHILYSQAESVLTLSDLYPEVIPKERARELAEKSKLVDFRRVREIEDRVKHDVIAINKAWEEVVSEKARPYINKCRTSADSTETAKAVQIKKSIEVIASSLENLRDIILEKAVEWTDIPHMDQTHQLDALPTVAGRPFAYFGELIQSDLDFWAFVYKNSVKGKWADATGNHHSANDLGIDGIKLQAEYCKRLGIGCMIAPSQVPGREFIADVVYAMARTAETMRNLASYIAWGKSDDVNIFLDLNPRRRKGSSAMPHKDIKGGNPIVEEHVESFCNYTRGALMTALSSAQMRYARDLSGSASDRVILRTVFMWGDQVIRRLANTVYWLGIDEKRSRERVERTLGTVTSSRILNYLTDERMVREPMARSEAHDLLGKLATKAYTEKIPFKKVLLESEEITRRLPKELIEKIADPLNYIGQSKEIIEKVFELYHGKKTLG